MHFIQGLNEVCDLYDAFIVDLWGVIHNGHHPFDGVRECLDALRKAGRPVAFLTNAPQRIHLITSRLKEMSIEPNLYSTIHSSGEDVYEYLQSLPASGTCFPLGNPGELGREKSLNMSFTDNIAMSDFILNAIPGTQDLTAWDDVLQLALHQKIPMLCVNPDLTAIHGKQKILCAGSFAERYAEMGGQVTWHGKPMKGVYKRILEKLGLETGKRVLAVGDSLRTDIAGGHGYGLDTLLVLTGIEGAALNLDPENPGIFLPEEKIREHCGSKGVYPDYVSFSFRYGNSTN